jgi:hypothetical protein
MGHSRQFGEPSPITNLDEFITASRPQAAGFMAQMLGNRQPVDDKAVTYLAAGLRHPVPEVVHDVTLLIQNLHSKHRIGLTTDRVLLLAGESMRSPSHITQAFMLSMVQHEIRKDNEANPDAVRWIIARASEQVLSWVECDAKLATQAAAVVHDTVMLRALSFLASSALEKGIISQDEADQLTARMQAKTAGFPPNHQLREITAQFIQPPATEPRRLQAGEEVGIIDPDGGIVTHPAASAEDLQSRL